MVGVWEPDLLISLTICSYGAGDRTGGTALPGNGRHHLVRLRLNVPARTGYYAVALFAAAAAHPMRPHHDRAGELELVYGWVGLLYGEGATKTAEQDSGVPMCGAFECAVSFDEKKVTVGRRAQAVLVDLHCEEPRHRAVVKGDKEETGDLVYNL